MFLAAVVALLLAAGPGGDSAPGRWESSGPAYPAIDLIVNAPDDESTVYAGAHDPASGKSALFRSRDGGTNWEMVAEAPPGETLTSFAIDPTGPERMLGLTMPASGLGHVYRSDDSGTTWRLDATFPSAGALFFDPGRPNTAFLTSGGGISYSAIGQNWVNWRSSPPPQSSFWISPKGIIFVEEFALDPCDSHSPIPTFINALLFGDLSGRNGGCTGAPCPSMGAVGYAPSDPNVAYAASFCGLFASENGGSVWTLVQSGDLKERLDSLSSGYLANVAINPIDDADLFVTASSAGEPSGLVLRSEDGGTHWMSIAVPATPTGPLAFSASGRFLYVDTDAGVYRLALSRTRTLAPRE